MARRPRGCKYTVIEGENQEKGQEVGFNVLKETKVNASFIKIRCKNEPLAHFVSLPHRPTNVAEKKREIKSKDRASRSQTLPAKPFNVFVIGLDSTSRLNAIRHLSKTRRYLLDSLNATEFVMFNKVGLNTRPNLAALFTGDTERLTRDDKGPTLWDNFHSKGFWTFYGDDWDTTAWAMGFNDAKLDRRFRKVLKFYETLPKQSDGSHGCIHGRRFGNMVQDYFADFLDAHRSYPEDSIFAFVWSCSWTHDYVNWAKMADQPTRRLMERINEMGDLDNAVLIFISDHGVRLDSFAKTFQGNMENNAPILFTVFPKWFHSQFSDLVRNIRVNSQRLVSVYDVRKTLLHLLHLQTNASEWENDFDGDGKSLSLLTPVPERSCTDARVPIAFCNCHRFEEVDVKETKVKMAADAFVQTVNEAMAVMKGKCAKLTLKEVDQSRKVRDEETYVLQMKMEPKGLFQAWVDMKSNVTIVDLKFASRLDRYGNAPYCVVDRDELKDFCQCLPINAVIAVGKKS